MEVQKSQRSNKAFCDVYFIYLDSNLINIQKRNYRYLRKKDGQKQE